jgi:plastocyanin
MKRLILLLVIVTLLPPGDLSEQEDSSKEYTITVDGTNLRFYPTALTINEGDSVRFLWGGEVLPHNAVEENGVFDSGEPEREVDYLYTFEFGQSGVYDFYCEPHQSVGMDGTITVTEVEQIDQDMDDEQIVSQSEIDDSDGFSNGIVVILCFILLLIYLRTRIDKISTI